MSEKSDIPVFQQYQFAFAGHIRNPQENRRPQGIPARRMKIYNELVYNNLESFLLACFPVLRTVLGKRKWSKLVRDFFSTHHCHTPLFRQIPDEFIQYLKTERGDRPEDPGYLCDLAHYEWVELMLSASNKQIDLALIEPHGDLLNGCPAINPLLSLQSYSYPVHRIGPTFKPTREQRGESHFAIVRTMQDEVKFILINPISLRLLHLLHSQRLTGKQALLQIAAEFKHPDPYVVLNSGQDILHSLCAAQVMLGTWRQPL